MHRNEVQTLDSSRFSALLDRYYERRGWDKSTGVPTREKLESLGLKDVVGELKIRCLYVNNGLCSTDHRLVFQPKV